MFFKNTANQIIIVYAWDTANNVWKTGDAANITAYISKDGLPATQTNDVNPDELSAANMPGAYLFNITQAETNCDNLELVAKSATANISIIPVSIYPTTLTKTLIAYLDAAISSRSTLAAGAEMDLVNAPNATAITAIQAGLTKLASTIDGAVDLQTALRIALSMASGKVSKSGDVYTFYKQDNTTTLFTLTIAAAARTRS